MSDFTDLIDVAGERLGGIALAANDEFFAPKEDLLKAPAPEWREGVYTDRGKWMDGWETRRRRTPGHDWCLVRLGIPARIHGVVVDTRFFRGNFPESCSLEACELPDADPEAEADHRELAETPGAPWIEIVSRSPLAGDTRNLFPVTYPGRVTHLRFNIFPDGGVARLRVHGDPMPDPGIFTAGLEVDLAAMQHGGFVVACSDMFFGERQNLILPGRALNMGDGWETRRRRGPGHDWTIVRLGARGAITRVEIDTDWYKGNAPGSCMLEWCDAPGATAEVLTGKKTRWNPLIAETPLEPDGRHEFEPASVVGPATHVRLNIYPDGGIARLRVFGLVPQPE
jgi:allantoicase